MVNQSGAKKWVDLELSDDEKADADFVVKAFTEMLEKTGVGKLNSVLKLEFSKSLNTAIPENLLSGSHHPFANGKPYYRMTMISDGSYFGTRPSTFYLESMMGLFSISPHKARLSLADTVVLTHDFTEAIQNKTRFLSFATKLIASASPAQRHYPYP